MSFKVKIRKGVVKFKNPIKYMSKVQNIKLYQRTYKGWRLTFFSFLLHNDAKPVYIFKNISVFFAENETFIGIF